MEERRKRVRERDEREIVRIREGLRRKREGEEQKKKERRRGTTK